MRICTPAQPCMQNLDFMRQIELLGNSSFQAFCCLWQTKNPCRSHSRITKRQCIQCKWLSSCLQTWWWWTRQHLCSWLLGQWHRLYHQHSNYYKHRCKVQHFQGSNEGWLVEAHKKEKKNKKKKYLQPCLNQHQYFTPFIMSNNGLIRKEAKVLLQKLSSAIAKETGKSYPKVCGFIWAIHLCLHGFSNGFSNLQQMPQLQHWGSWWCLFESLLTLISVKFTSLIKHTPPAFHWHIISLKHTTAARQFQSTNCFYTSSFLVSCMTHYNQALSRPKLHSHCELPVV